MRVLSIDKKSLRLVIEVTAKEWGVLLLGLGCLRKHTDQSVVASSKEVLDDCEREFSERAKAG